MQDKAPAAQGLSLLSIDVHADRMVCRVALSPGTPRMSDARVAAWLQSRLPTLGRHACVNDRGPTFSFVMDATPLPHVLEHVVIDLQVRADAEREDDGPEAAYVGTTEWVDRNAGIARVEVSYADDIVALRSLRDGVALVNDALTACGRLGEEKS